MTTQNGNTIARRESQALVPDQVGPSLFSQLPPAHQEILTKRIALGATRPEIELFLMQAEAEGLNPWAMPPEIWLIERSAQVNGQWVNQHVPQASKDGKLRAAKARGVYLTHSFEHYVAGQWYRDGDEPDGAAHPDRTRCTIPIVGHQGQAVTFVARYAERVQRRKDGTVTDFWKRMPFEMLAKCALVGALKLLPDAGTVEVADVDYDEDEGLAQRRFWARVTDMGKNEADVRAAMLVGPGESLAEAVDRYGGWSKAESRVLSLFEVRPTAYLGTAAPPLPNGESANSLLYASAPEDYATGVDERAVFERVVPPDDDDPGPPEPPRPQGGRQGGRQAESESTTRAEAVGAGTSAASPSATNEMEVQSETLGPPLDEDFVQNPPSGAQDGQDAAPDDSGEQPHTGAECPVCGDPLAILGFDERGEELAGEFCASHQLEADLHNLPEEVINAGTLVEYATVRKGLSRDDVLRAAKRAAPTWPKAPGAGAWKREDLASIWRQIPLAPPPHVEPQAAVEALQGLGS